MDMSHQPWEFVIATCIETCAIAWFASKPRPDWIHSFGAAFTANLAAFIAMLLLRPLIETYWMSTLPERVEIGLLNPLFAWFVAFSLANAAELAVLKWVWKIPISTTLTVLISLSNAVSAVLSIWAIITKG